MDAIGTFIPTDRLYEGRMLNEGAVTVTVTSRATLHHVTLRLRCTTDGEDTVPFADATHIVIESADDLRLATYYPLEGEIAFNPRIDRATRWCVGAVIRYVAGQNPALLVQALVDSESFELV